MAKINIQAGIISSSADYSLYHGTTKVADIEQNAIRIEGDLIAENYIVSSSTTYMTTSFSDGSTIFGNSAGDTHVFTGSLQVSGTVANESYIIGTKVGIGTSSPDADLHIAQGSDNRVMISSNGPTLVFKEDNSTDENWAFYHNAGVLNIRTMNDSYGSISDKVSFLQNGNVGIGVTDPDEKLEIHGNLRVRSSNNENRFLLTSGAGGDDAQFKMYNNAETNNISLDASSGKLWYTGGKLGIGTSGPYANLDVSGSGYVFAIKGAGTTNQRKFGFYQSSAVLRILGLNDSDVNQGDILTLEHASAGGKVGIGTTSPDTGYKLHVATAGDHARLKIETTGAGEYDTLLMWENPDQTWYQYIDDSDSDKFKFSNAAVVMTMTTDNKVGIGTTSPNTTAGGAMLDVSETGTNSDARIVSRTSEVTASFGAAQGTARWFTSGPGLGILTNSDHPIQFATNVTAGSAQELLILNGNKISGSSTSTGSFGAGYIDNKLGIGTDAPSTKLHVYSSAANQVRVERSTGGNTAIHYKNTSDDWYAGITSQQDFSISQNADIASGTEFRIQDSTGNVGIGTDSPFTTLHIDKNSHGYMMMLEGAGGYTTADKRKFAFYQAYDYLNMMGMNDSNVNQGAIISFSHDGHVGADSFISGITGDGYRITNGGDDGYSLEIDNIMVRNTLRTHIFQKDVVKATNGILYISDSGVISGSNGTNTVTFLDSKSATFADNTRLWYKDVRENDGTVISVQFDIAGSGTTAGGSTTYSVDNIVGSLGDVTGSLGNSGGTAVRISGGSLVLDASSANSPYMDVLSSSGSASGTQMGGTKVRLGNLAGITTPQFGTLSGFGLWASGSAFLEGSINATSGKIAGWTISGSFLGKGNLRLSSSGETLIAGNGGTDTGTGNIRAIFGKYDGTNYGMRVWDGTNTFVRLTSAGNNEIAGWALTPTMISSSGGNVQVDAGNSRFLIKDPAGQQRVRMGLLNASSQYGISGSDADGNLLFKLGEAGNVIAGWEISQSRIHKPRTGNPGGLILDADNLRYDVYSGSDAGATTNIVRMGQLDTSGNYGIRGYDTVGSELFKLGMLGNVIAGWEISSSRIVDATHKVFVDAGNSRFLIKNSSGNEMVRMGLLNATQYGISGSDSSGNLLFKLGEAGNEIAGWTIAQGTIHYDDSGGSLALSANSQSLNIFTGSINYEEPKLVLGKLPLHDGTVNEPYGLAVFSGTGVVSGSEASASVLITANKARLAGWELTPGKLSSGTVASIDGNQASIALGTGASTAGATPADNLFFVSASTNPVFYVGKNFSYTDNVLTAAGWKISSGQISSSNGQAILSGSGVLSLGSGTHDYAQANRTYIDGPGNRMSIGEDFTYTGGVLSVGGWKIGNNIISSSVGPATAGITIQALSSHQAIVVHGAVDGEGHQTFGPSNIKNVRLAFGELTSNKYGIKGFDDSANRLFELSETRNEIAGWNFVADKLYVGTNQDVAGYTAAGGDLIISSSGAIHSKEFYMDAAGNAAFSGDISAGTGTLSNALTVGSNFSVDASGNMNASNAKFSGSIKALGGHFAGNVTAGDVTIGTGGITGTGYTINSSGIQMSGDSTIDINSAFIATSTGQVTGSTLQFKGGSIGGMTVAETKVYVGTDLVLTAGGQLTASAAQISGKITADDGEIGGFSITNNAISSSATPKRGLILKPGDAIRGYGNAAHSTTCIAGKYSFGVAPVAPPAGGDGGWDSDFPPDGGGGGSTL